jgi:hypothetical protein
VDIDLSKFFDRVHHQRLLGRMSEQMGDGRVLKLIHRSLKVRHLVSRGVSGGMARKAVYGIRGHWTRSASFGVHKAYPNAWFSERLVSLTIRWNALNPPRASAQLLLFGDD